MLTQKIFSQFIRAWDRGILSALELQIALVRNGWDVEKAIVFCYRMEQLAYNRRYPNYGGWKPSQITLESLNLKFRHQPEVTMEWYVMAVCSQPSGTWVEHMGNAHTYPEAMELLKRATPNWPNGIRRFCALEIWHRDANNHRTREYQRPMEHLNSVNNSDYGRRL